MTDEDDDWTNPNFEAADPTKPVHDWRNHIGERTRALWHTFTDEQRKALRDDAEERAMDEVWDG